MTMTTHAPRTHAMARGARMFAGAIPPVPPQALAIFHASVGAFILYGGELRFGGPSFAGARALVTAFGVPERSAWLFWGVLLFTAGLSLLFVWPKLERSWPRAATAAVLFGAAPMTFVVIGFITSTHGSPLASSSGIGAYGAVAVAHVHTAIKMVAAGAWDHDRRTPEGLWDRRRNGRR